jgi:hypothetical protein
MKFLRIAGLVLLTLTAGATIWGLVRVRTNSPSLPAVSLPVVFCPDIGSEVSLQEAQQSAKFTFFLPNHPDANTDNLQAVCLMAQGTDVGLKFPDPLGSDRVSNSPSMDVRQPYITVYEEVWGNGDPLTDFKNDIAFSPEDGKKICEVKAGPALCVEANSPSDSQLANPAYLRFVADGTHIMISGSSDLQRLIDIADSMSQPAAD